MQALAVQATRAEPPAETLSPAAGKSTRVYLIAVKMNIGLWGNYCGSTNNDKAAENRTWYSHLRILHLIYIKTNIL